MPEDLGERTEEATPRRREEAREEGNVARSQDLSGAIVLAASTVAMWFAANHLIGNGSQLVAAALEPELIGSQLVADDAWALLGYLGSAAVQLAAPVIGIVWLAAMLSQLSQIGLLFAPKGLQPQLKRLNPISGFQRIFGINAIVKATLDSAKVFIVMVVAALTITQRHSDIMKLPHLHLADGLAASGMLMVELALRIVAVLALLGIVDFMYQRWKHSRDLRMTKQQVRDEMKMTDGDPDVKARRSKMQQQISMQRIKSAVPTADVIVTNPEHISIAIQYVEGEMHAPRVVAKGADFLALRIRQIAAQHGVPIVERKPLARAMYRQVQVGQQIPPEFYKAIAEVLAFVYRMDQRAAG